MYQLEIDGWFNEGDLKVLQKLAAFVPENGNVIEIGSHLGRSTVAWLDHIPETATMYAMDHWGMMNHRNEFKGIDRYKVFIENTKGYKNLVPIKTFSPPKEDLGVMFDLVFIDGNHGYEFVKADIEYWSARIKSGGILCGHDYRPYWSGVTRAVDEFIAAKNLPHEFGADTSKMWIVYM